MFGIVGQLLVGARLRSQNTQFSRPIEGGNVTCENHPGTVSLIRIRRANLALLRAS